MSKISASQIKPGQFLSMENKLWRVTATERAKPGKGGAFIQVDSKSIDNVNKRHKFRSDEDVEVARLDEHAGKFLYNQQSEYYFLNIATNDILSIDRNNLDDSIELIEQNTDVKLLSNEGVLLNVELPAKITCKVDDIVQNSAGTKVATVNGLRITVPAYIEAGEMIVINSADKTFAQRAKSE